MDEKRNPAISIFDKVYMITTALLCACLLLASYLDGFRPEKWGLFLHLIIPIWFLSVIVTIVYDIILIIMRLVTKKWHQSYFTTFVPLIYILLLFIMPIVIVFGEVTALKTAGPGNLVRDGDVLMARASSEPAVFPTDKYPESFKKLGAARVIVSNSSIEIYRTTRKNENRGYVIFATLDHKDTAYKRLRQRGDRIFKFTLN